MSKERQRNVILLSIKSITTGNSIVAKVIALWHHHTHNSRGEWNTMYALLFCNLIVVIYCTNLAKKINKTIFVSHKQIVVCKP